jgi:hypothetical protein
MGIDPVRLSYHRILLSSPPASTPSKTDLQRGGRGQHVNYEKAGFADNRLCLNAAFQIPIWNTIWRIARKKLRYDLATST